LDKGRTGSTKTEKAYPLRKALKVGNLGMGARREELRRISGRKGLSKGGRLLLRDGKGNKKKKEEHPPKEAQTSHGCMRRGKSVAKGLKPPRAQR